MRSGQALIMVLLLLSVVITVGLAISSRSVTEVGISTTQEESARALAAAEAGIEAALSGRVATGANVSVGTTGTYIVPAPSQYGAGNQVTFAPGLHPGEVATVFLQVGTQKYTAPSVMVCWGDTTASTVKPALEAITYYQNNGNYLTTHSVYDPQSGRTSGAASPDTSTSGCPSDKSYAYKATINLPSGTLYYLRLKLAYNGDTSSPLGVVRTGAGQFPDQGQLVTSTGQAGQTSRKVQVVQRYADLLPYLDNAVFSGGSLSK